MTTATAMVKVTGTTFPIKSYLREYGGRWDGEGWILPAEEWAKFSGDYHGANKRGREIAAAIAGCVASPVDGD